MGETAGFADAICKGCGEPVLLTDHETIEHVRARALAQLPAGAKLKLKANLERADGSTTEAWIAERRPTGFTCPGCGQANAFRPEPDARPELN